MRLLAFFILICATPAAAETIELRPVPVTEWKSVYATVEARRTVPARARIGGTLAEIGVSEGDTVAAGDAIGRVSDDKLEFQLAALDAQIAAAEAQLRNAEAELTRGETLVERGVSTAQRLDALRTQVDVAKGQILSLEAERSRVTQTQAEGTLLAPAGGEVLTVPVAAGQVILPGEPVAMIGTGGFFLRLQLPERYAGGLVEGAEIAIGDEAMPGRLAKIYPQIEGGRVQADIEVEDIDARFAGARVPVRLPVGEREALAVPEAALEHRGGLDFIIVMVGEAEQERSVIRGEPITGADGAALVEIVSGISAGEAVVVP